MVKHEARMADTTDTSEDIDVEGVLEEDTEDDEEAIMSDVHTESESQEGLPVEVFDIASVLEEEGDEDSESDEDDDDDDDDGIEDDLEDEEGMRSDDLLSEAASGQIDELLNNTDLNEEDETALVGKGKGKGGRRKKSRKRKRRRRKSSRSGKRRKRKRKGRRRRRGRPSYPTVDPSLTGCAAEAALKERLAAKLTSPGNMRKAPSFLRFAFHDAVDHNNLLKNKGGRWEWFRNRRWRYWPKWIKVPHDKGDYGGMDGCLHSPLSGGAFGKPVMGHNWGLEGVARMVVEDAKTAQNAGLCKTVEDCMVDIFAFSALTAIEQAGGPSITMKWGRKKGYCGKETLIVGRRRKRKGGKGKGKSKES